MNSNYTTLIRDGMLSRLASTPFFAGFTFSRSSALQTQPEDVPHLGCYVVDEVMTEDGEHQTGVVRLFHSLRIGFSVIMQNNDPDDMEGKLDAAFWGIMNRLLADETLLSNDVFKIQGFTRAVRTNSYGHAGRENEIPIAEMRLELTCTYKTDWPPATPDDFLTMHLETRYPTADTDPAVIQQVIMSVDIPQNE